MCYFEYNGPVHWLVLLVIVYWENHGWDDNRIEFGHNPKVYFWCDTQVVVWLGSFFNSNYFHSRFNFRLRSGVHDRSGLNLRWVHVEIFHVFSDNYVYYSSDKFTFVHAVPNANRKAKSKGCRKTGEFLFQNIRKTQHTWDFNRITSENILRSSIIKQRAITITQPSDPKLPPCKVRLQNLLFCLYGANMFEPTLWYQRNIVLC